MIYYFSATGNSRFIAEKLAEKTGEKIGSLNDCIRLNKEPEKDDGYVFVVPTYAWRIPKIVNGYLEKCDIPAQTPVWFIMTCGGEIGNADRYLNLLCKKKGWIYKGVLPLLMPDYYIALFSSVDFEKGKKLMDVAKEKLFAHICHLERGEHFPPVSVGFGDRFMSSAVNFVFYPVIVKSKPFYAKDNCVACGKCEKVCPLGNISIRNGKPVWGKNCTHCMACINFCPTTCIEYGTKTKGKKRLTAYSFTDK